MSPHVSSCLFISLHVFSCLVRVMFDGLDKKVRLGFGLGLDKKVRVRVWRLGLGLGLMFD